MNLEVHNQPILRWWKKLWKLQCPAKAKILCWTILENKAPSCDALQRRCFQGLGRCTLCCNSLETLDHLFLHCQYTQQIWQGVGLALKASFIWPGPNFMETFRLWFVERAYLPYKALPCIISWGVWLAINKTIFQDLRIPLEVIVANILDVFQHFP